MLNNISIITTTNIFIIHKDTKDLLTTSKVVNNLYYLLFKIIKPLERTYNISTNKSTNKTSNNYNTSHLYKNETISLKTTHKRLSHINIKALNKLKDNTISYTIINSTNFDINKCKECNKAKIIRQRYKVSLNNLKQLNYLEKVTSNIYSSINPKTYNSYKYFITFLDKKT